jgi:hypothetical protein
VPSRFPFKVMISLSHPLTVDEIDTAANYFSGLKPFVNIRVIESEEVPLTFEKGWHLTVLDEKFKPIGARIIEVPADLERFECVGYVPIGSIARGKHISTSGSGNLSCVSCHGEGNCSPGGD